MQAANQHHIKLQLLQLQLANDAQCQLRQLPPGPRNALARHGIALQRHLKDERRMAGVNFKAAGGEAFYQRR